MKRRAPAFLFVGMALAIGCSIYGPDLLVGGDANTGPSNDSGRDVTASDGGTHGDGGKGKPDKDTGGGGGPDVVVTGDGGAPKSCIDGGPGTGAQCGPNGQTDCCSVIEVPGGMFYRNTVDGGQATITSFYLDRYEVTVGRFRKFVNEGYGLQTNPPKAGSGANPHVPGSGWQSVWNSQLPTIASLNNSLMCENNPSDNPTWTPSPASDEILPINCMTWYQAFAFCVWDGGRLPTDAEWDYAASGGKLDRYYPWSVPSTSEIIDPSYAAYLCTGHGGPTEYADGGVEAGIFYCSTNDITPPGHFSPKGDGLFGHSDMAGDMFEWVLDWSSSAFIVPCDDCAELETGPLDAGGRLLRSGGYDSTPDELFTFSAYYDDPLDLEDDQGMRCARDIQ